MEGAVSVARTVREAARKATEKTEQRVSQHFEKMLRERERELRAVNEINDKLIDRLARAETREQMLQEEVARLRGFGGGSEGAAVHGRHR